MHTRPTVDRRRECAIRRRRSRRAGSAAMMSPGASSATGTHVAVYGSAGLRHSSSCRVVAPPTPRSASACRGAACRARSSATFSRSRSICRARRSGARRPPPTMRSWPTAAWSRAFAPAMPRNSSSSRRIPRRRERRSGASGFRYSETLSGSRRPSARARARARRRHRPTTGSAAAPQCAGDGRPRSAGWTAGPDRRRPSAPSDRGVTRGLQRHLHFVWIRWCERLLFAPLSVGSSVPRAGGLLESHREIERSRGN
mmetsp:Transcript_27460/g.90845  ORF Transcript_27460/g.90845 Transcript_27460/m.90845 type:complete len:256 (+) Transcript_27460:75-842(+)